MRSSSIKSFAATLTLVAVVSTTAAVNLDARPARTPQDSVASIRDHEDKLDRAYRAFLRLVQRFFGPVANANPTIPIPTDTAAGTGTTSIGT